jgi:hypothetical protein
VLWQFWVLKKSKCVASYLFNLVVPDDESVSLFVCLLMTDDGYCR